MKPNRSSGKRIICQVIAMLTRIVLIEKNTIYRRTFSTLRLEKTAVLRRHRKFDLEPKRISERMIITSHRRLRIKNELAITIFRAMYTMTGIIVAKRPVICGLPREIVYGDRTTAHGTEVAFVGMSLHRLSCLL